jgi:hypothetical protein
VPGPLLSTKQRQNAQILESSVEQLSLNSNNRNKRMLPKSDKLLEERVGLCNGENDNTESEGL